MSRGVCVSTSACWLAEVTRWLVVQPAARDLGIGYFGSSIGGGAALVAAAEVGQRIDAVVSRGGRPDLAGDALPRVQLPTRLIVGGYDDAVIRLNKEALAELRCEKELKIVPARSKRSRALRPIGLADTCTAIP